MYKKKNIVVVMPAYNAAQTLQRTYDAVMEEGIVDLVIVVDDSSTDDTVTLARSLPHAQVHIHEKNMGYGANQKTCYKEALKAGADIVVMVHPDYQYTPKLLPAMVSVIANDLYPCMLASRILGGSALKGGMPVWKYFANRFLTGFQNLMTGAKLSEYHSGYRAFSAELLRSLPLQANSDDFVFDNQMLAQILYKNHVIGEVTCPTMYFDEASSINFRRSMTYGLGCIATSVKFRLSKWHLMEYALFSAQPETSASAAAE